MEMHVIQIEVPGCNKNVKIAKNVKLNLFRSFNIFRRYC